jgi:hypothetical protein
MQKSSKKIAVGIGLLLCLPLFVVAAGVLSYTMPKFYFSDAFIEVGETPIQDLNATFDRVAPKSSDVRLEKVQNTDLVVVHVRDSDAQRAADRANAIASALQDGLQKQVTGMPRIKMPAEPGTIAMRPRVLLNMLVGGVLGLFAALVGLILIVLGARGRTATQSA